MHVLVVGGGGREHALAWKLRQSPRVTDLFIAPGNAGTAEIGTNLPISTADFEGIAAAAREHGVELVVVGPDQPVADGLVDFLQERGIPAYGPTQAAARLESSKSFAKEIMRAAGIPTAEARAFDDLRAAIAYAAEVEDRTGNPPVVKADGLAAGKGVTVAQTLSEAEAAIRSSMEEGAFGASGTRVVLEERMAGREASAHAFCDGKIAVPMVYSRDYKRAHDGDQGPNTGGMGAYTPPPYVDDALAAQVQAQILDPLMRVMAERGYPYTGTLYPGLMLTEAGLRVVEFNARSGDPETQVLMPRLDSDLLEIMLACVEGRLSEVEIRWSPRPAVGVVVASEGYPGPHKTGVPVEGLDDLDGDIEVFHAGTRLEDGRVLTTGGRVLTVVARGDTVAEAREHAYDNVRRLRFPGIFYRRDLARDGER